MEEFLRNYGLWILLAAVFLGMHWFGVGCGGGHRHGAASDEKAAGSDETKKKTTAHAGQRGGCH